MADRAPDDRKQNALVHEPGQAEDLDSNERGDDKASIEQPSGKEVPQAPEE
jgi:hypothetical protein